MGEGWLDARFSGLRQIGVRDLLVAAAERFRRLAKPSAEPRPKAPLEDLFAIEANTIRANGALQRYNQDCLMWFAEALAAGHRDVEIRKTRGRYFTIEWAWPDRSIFFAFESGDNNARWRAIARDAVALIGRRGRSGAIVFRTPDLRAIPRPTWIVATAHLKQAQKQGFRIERLSLDEVCELHAARELYSNALQGNISYDPVVVLQWLRARFQPWLERCSTPLGPADHDEEPAPAAATNSDPAHSASP